MTRCDPVDIVYYTFWPILAFSFFIATDEIIKEDRFAIDITNAQLYAIAIIIEKFVHMFALLCLVVSLLETYLAFQLLRDTNCNRIIFLELNALTAAFFLLLLSLIDCFSSIFPMTNRINDFTFMMCKLIPFCVSLILLVYQLTRILFNSGVVRREGNLFTIKIIGTKK